MIPWVVGRELRATLLDYLRSTWAIADGRVEAALFDFLAGPQGVFQGPYLKLNLPFAPCRSDLRPPLDVFPKYQPHLHQLEAWQRLSSRGQTPQATLITTGTGSGKTECFLYPVLDHVFREVAAGRRGIKAIVLYPMNALASDQAQRFGGAIWGDERLRGRIRVGLFVGGQGAHQDMGRDHVVDSNDHLREEPPDILLTNYRMLDLLLQRPKDARLWRDNGPDTLRYLVLDELHTYDGAQGTDVACLIRRLGHRLGSAENVCPVGTSATVGGGGNTRTELLRFASTLFDQPFPVEAFIGETRLGPRDLLRDRALEERYPAEGGPWPGAGETAPQHVANVVRAWLPAEARAEILLPPDQRPPAGPEAGPTDEPILDRVALGRWALRVPLCRELLTGAHDRPRAAAELDAGLRAALPRFAEGSPAERQGWMAAALSLISFSQREADGNLLPLVSVQGTLWVREVRRLLRRVGGPPAFRFHDDVPPDTDEPTTWLPCYACQDCGHSGWLVLESGPGDTLGLEYKDIARAYRESAQDLRLLHEDDQLQRERDEEESDAGRRAWLDRRAGRLLDKATDESIDPVTGVPRQPAVHVVEPSRGRIRCPSCALETIRILAARSAALSSVAVGHLFTTPLNTDRKLLAFSDSVQDAAHRAGFFSARTYRFAMRSALLAAVPREGTLPLAALGEATWNHWVDSLRPKGMSAEAELAAIILPQDLHWLPSVQAWHDALDDLVRRRRHAEETGDSAPGDAPPPSPELVADLKQRLRWEGTRELGLAARIGRTLEQSGSLSVTVDRQRLEAALAELQPLLREKLGQDAAPSLPVLRTAVAGLLTRLRLRGGVHDPLLDGYMRAGGEGIFLTKLKAPLLSPFPRETSRPVFLTDAPKPRRFDSVSPARAGTWVVDWLVRSCLPAADPAIAAAVYRAMLPVLTGHRILVGCQSDERGPFPGTRAWVWGLDPAALLISRQHVTRRCDACGSELPAVEGSPTDPLDGPCMRFRCLGRMRQVKPALVGHERAASGDAFAEPLPVASYYRRFYERGELGRLWSREHTGLLGRSAREELELEFKLRPRPDSPNLLSCTPTLEMGIDIGDLSATLLCSVPPAAANYVQRVGRAGRKTGNALILAFAATRPHDLYFFQQPLEAMAGAISPPGCYLSAPEVLKRQALAFIFDSLAREGTKLPGRVKEAILGDPDKRFPRAVLDFVGARRERLQAEFLEMFRGELTPATRAALRAQLAPEADGLSRLEIDLRRTVDEARERREELRRLAQRLDERYRLLTSDENEARKEENLAEELRSLLDERRFVGQQLDLLVEQDLWGWLTREGRLPNYAFPEPGVKLDAYIRREGPGREPEHHSWVRAASAALKELAPFNTFYASARRVKVSGVELKRESTPTTWRFCRTCHHAERDSVAESPAEQCPRCGDGGWADIGQQRKVVVMGQVFAVAQHRDAVLGDDSEDREKHYYEDLSLFEAEAEAREAWSNEAAGFGFELQPRMILRRLNLGSSDEVRNQPRALIADRQVPDVRFMLCRTCGHAQRPAEPRAPGAPAPTNHRAWCPEKKKAQERQPREEVHLLSELQSEALRLVVPLADAPTASSDLANLRAALRLGLRRFYGGDPDFLEVGQYDEPLPGREGRRRYLVIMDRVPGGTGLLAELCLDRGAKLEKALVEAYQALRGCPCQRREPPARACYQCLYLYRDQESFPVLDRARALEIVERLLEAFDSLARVDSVGTMTQSRVLESELEDRFVGALQAQVEEEHGSWHRIDEGSWRLKVGGRTWLVRSQVELGRDRVPIPCRADFMLYPAEPGPGVRPVAVFTDGLAFHVMPGRPESCLSDDAGKRWGICQGGEYLTWSLAWKDVVTPQSPPVPSWFGTGTILSHLQSAAHRLDAASGRGRLLEGLVRVLEADPLRGLVAYLAAPEGLDRLGRLAAALLLEKRGRRLPADVAATLQAEWRTAATARSVDDAALEGGVSVAELRLGEHARLLLDVEAARIGRLLHEPSPLRVTLRLEDDLERRSQASYETSWRMWLRAWNLLQVLPGAALVTGSMAASGRATRLRTDAAAGTPQPAPVRAPADDARLAVAREITDPEAQQVVTELLERHPELPPPRVPLELRHLAFGMDADLEIGWPERHVAVHFEAQAQAAQALRAAGWTLFSIERKLDLRALERALGLD